MVEHMCNNCKKTFKNHTNFINHTQKRKTPCVSIVKNITVEKNNLPIDNKFCPIFWGVQIVAQIWPLGQLFQKFYCIKIFNFPCY